MTAVARVPRAAAHGLAAARGRDARALRRPRLARRRAADTCSASAAARRCTSLFAWAVAHLGGGLTGCGWSRRVFARGERPADRAARSRGLTDRPTRRRRGGARVRRAGCCSSTAIYGAHVQPLPLHEPALVSRAPLGARRAAGGGAGRSGRVADPRAASRRTPTARSCSRRRACSSCCAARGCARRSWRSRPWACSAIPFWLRRPRARRTGSTSASAAAARSSAGPLACCSYLWRRRRRLRRRAGRRPVVLGAARRAGRARCSGGERRRAARCSSPRSLRRRRSRSCVARARQLDASPESRHLIFVLPFFASARRVAARRARAPRPPLAGARALVAVPALSSSARCAWACAEDAAALRRRAGERRPQARERGRRMARRGRAGRTTSCSATSPSTCGPGSGTRTSRASRAPARGSEARAPQTLEDAPEAARPRRLGPRRERHDERRRARRRSRCASPRPAGVRGARVRAVPRHPHARAAS